MADTYTGECKKCNLETDLIQGICMECFEIENNKEKKKEEKMLDKMTCKKCGNEMEYLGNVSGMIYTSNPPQWDDVYVCDKCKTKETIREHGQTYDPTGGRNIGAYTEQEK